MDKDDWIYKLVFNFWGVDKKFNLVYAYGIFSCLLREKVVNIGTYRVNYIADSLYYLSPMLSSLTFIVIFVGINISIIWSQMTNNWFSKNQNALIHLIFIHSCLPIGRRLNYKKPILFFFRALIAITNQLMLWSCHFYEIKCKIFSILDEHLKALSWSSITLSA